MMKKLYLSYSLIVMTFDRLYALRDPYGNRPICVAKIFAKEKPGKNKFNFFSTNVNTNVQVDYQEIMCKNLKILLKKIVNIMKNFFIRIALEIQLGRQHSPRFFDDEFSCREARI